MIQILPGILAATQEDFDTMIEKVKPFASLVHVDTADGVFTKTKFVGPEVVAAIPEDIAVDVHMMVEKPEETVSAWLAIPQVKRIIFHIEATDKTEEIINTVQRAGKEVGLALNPETPISAVEPFVHMFDILQFMSVSPGQYGAEFQSHVLGKMSEFHKKYPDIKIAIDGGVSPERIPEMLTAGATIFVSGGYVMNNQDAALAFSELQKAIDQSNN